MHVHSWYSGMCLPPPFRGLCRESYSQPEDVYHRLKRRGMDLVTLTDHDSIEGADELRRYPDFFTSVEVTCTLPSGAAIHAGVYDVSERQHAEIQRRRDDFPALVAYLREQGLFFSLHHFFSGLTGARKREDFASCGFAFPAVETRNGHMLPGSNGQAARYARRLRKRRVGGSDAHTLASAGTAYTWVPGARDKHEFLQGLRRGRARVCGGCGSYFKLTRDAFLITGAMMRERPWTATLAPFLAILPAATFVNYAYELVFTRYWRSRWEPFAKSPLRCAGTAPQESWA